ncbi:MAG: hypothetical protein R2853_20205 [Thermomicrobiales bacterium]
MYRRRFVSQSASLALSLVVGVHVPQSAAAQEARPSTGLAELGLPEIVIAVDDAGFTLPDYAAAGRTLVTVRNTGSKELHFFATRIPDEVTDEQIAAEMQADSEDDPPWFDMTSLPFLGTPDWPAAGGEAQGVVDLLAGRWVFIDPIDGRDVAILAVSEGTPVPAVEPAAEVVITMQEMSFAGLGATLPAGPHVWKITNSGALEHEIAITKVPDGTTNTDVIGMIGDMLTGSEPPSTFAPICGQGIASRGVASWQAWNLAAGTYAAVCMSPMPGEGFEPHALEGMVQVFTVA